jgi:hypothetical protein
MPDAELVLTLIVAGCAFLGVFSGRWWVLLAAIPVGVVMGLLSDPWELSKFYCGVMWGLLALVTLAVAVAVRKLTGVVHRHVASAHID